MNLGRNNFNKRLNYSAVGGKLIQKNAPLRPKYTF